MVRDLADEHSIARAATEDELIAAKREEFGDDFSFSFKERDPAQVRQEKQERADSLVPEKSPTKKAPSRSGPLSQIETA